MIVSHIGIMALYLLLIVYFVAKIWIPRCIYTCGKCCQKIVIRTGYPEHYFRRIYNKNPTIFGQIFNPKLGTFCEEEKSVILFLIPKSA